MKICVIGCGYVGLVTGACLADFGNDVVCIDNDAGKIAALNKGVVDFFELGLSELIRKNAKAKRLVFSQSLPFAVTASQVIFITVGTPPLPNGEADLTAIEKVSVSLAKILKNPKRGFKVIVVKSTVPVGTSARVEKILKDGGVNLRKFEVISNPEFLREGKAVYDFLHPDRIVIGAVSNRSSNIMSELYRPLNARIVVMDRQSSELVKYAANAFLATRISFVNEIANICELVGADVRRVVEGIGFDNRIGHAYLKPGIGFGGSCLPKDMLALTYLADKSNYDAKLLKSVSSVNLAQRQYFVDKIEAALQGVKGKRLAVWGLSFKPQTDDLRDAPSLFIIEELRKKGASLRVYDPMANGNLKLWSKKVKWAKTSYEAARQCDAVIILTEWNEFREVDFHKVRSIMRDPLFIDGRNIFDPKVLMDAGIKYHGIGIRT